MNEKLITGEAEALVLGAMLIDGASAVDDVSMLLQPEDFRRSHHGDIYRAILRVHAQGRPVDPVTVKAALAAMPNASRDITPADILALTDGVPRTTNVAHYARIVLEHAKLRRAHQMLSDLADLAKAGTVTSADLAEQVEAKMQSLASGHREVDWRLGEDLALRVFSMVEAYHQNPQAVSGVPSGLKWLDRTIGGWQPGDLIIVGARPGVGKTAFGVQVAMEAAKTTLTAIVSIEMSDEQIAMRAALGASGINGERVKTGQMGQYDFDRMGQAITSLSTRQWAVLDAPGLSPVSIRAWLRKLALRHGTPGLVVIDYLQLIEPLPDQRRESRHLQVGGISRALKLMAKEFKCPFVVLAQLGRASEQRQDKRPVMADLRESGNLEQDCDIGLLLHRPELYSAAPEDQGIMEIIIGKHRNGPTGLVKAKWHASAMQFSDWNGPES